MSDTQQMKKPDPPGGEEFVVQSKNARFDCLSRGSMSTMTDPYGPNLSPPTISSHSIPDAVSSQNTNNESFTVGLISNSTNDPDDSCNAYPDHHDFQLLSIGFPHQALVLNHVQQYCSSRGFMTFHHAKDHFTPDQYEKYFPGETYHTNSRPVRRGIFYCSPKSNGRKKNERCCFQATYLWCNKTKSFVFSRRATNLSHNHPLLSLLTVVDGRDVVYLESALTAEEYQTIKEQSVSRVTVPQMRVNLEELFPSRSFSPPMLYRMRDKFLKDKYGADGHNLTGLFMKAETIKHLGGRFLVVPSSTDFSIETIHCQTKLMGEYARIYGDFKMADGTHKITQYDMTFVFWMVIDCLLRSKFVGYTANFTENSDVINSGVEIFFEEDSTAASVFVEQNKILVGGIPGYFDPFVDNEVDLVVVTGEQELASVHKKKATGFMTDEGPAFPLVSERFGWTHLLDRRHFATQILSAWHGLDDPQQFQSDVYKILDTPSVETMNLLLKQALSKYRTDKAQSFLKKILDKQHQLCYSHTCHTFTAGHVSDQRMEQGMAAIKANGKLKSMLSECNYSEAISRIS
jgi:hypothetical protein